MSAPSTAMCCTYGAPLMIPLQFQDWTQIEESDWEDVHVAVVTDFVRFHNFGSRGLNCQVSYSLAFSVNSRFTSSIDLDHIGVMLQFCSGYEIHSSRMSFPV